MLGIGLLSFSPAIYISSLETETTLHIACWHVARNICFETEQTAKQQETSLNCKKMQKLAWIAKMPKLVSVTVFDCC